MITSYMEIPLRISSAGTSYPGRQAALRTLYYWGVPLRCITNQAGVAFGRVREAEVWRKFQQVTVALELPALEFAVC